MYRNFEVENFIVHPYHEVSVRTTQSVFCKLSQNSEKYDTFIDF